VGRLIAAVGRLGRQMAALPEKAEGMDTLPGTLCAQLTCAKRLRMLLWRMHPLQTAQRQRTRHRKKPSLHLQLRAAAKRRRRARNESRLADIFSCDTASLASVFPIFASLASHDSPYESQRNHHVSVTEVLRLRRSPGRVSTFLITSCRAELRSPIKQALAVACRACDPRPSERMRLLDCSPTRYGGAKVSK
jgi:hypothetical protein